MNKIIKTAIVGLGKITHVYEDDPLILKRMKYPTHWSVLRKHPGFQLIAAQDKLEAARESFREKVGQEVRIYNDYCKLIQKERPDLLVVATSTESHVEVCKKALGLGIKNILCEKPTSYSLKEAKSLIALAKKKETNLIFNYFRAYNPSYIQLINKLRSGYLGKPQSFEAKYAKGIFNNATHLIDLLTRLFGEVNYLKGFSNPTFSDNHFIDPTISAAILFKNGVAGYIHGLNNDFYNIFELDLLYEKGRIIISNDKAKIFQKKPSLLVKGYNSLEETEDKELMADIFLGFYPIYDYIWEIAKNKKTEDNSKQAFYILKVANSCLVSSRKNKKIYAK